jgi:hypothetical protein
VCLSLLIRTLRPEGEGNDLGGKFQLFAVGAPQTPFP